jgi:hypothetical protein
LRNTLAADNVLRNLTVREAMETMESLVKITYSGRDGHLYTETYPTQRKILEAFQVPLPS